MAASAAFFLQRGSSFHLAQRDANAARRSRTQLGATSREYCYPEGCAAPCCVRCQCDTRESVSKLDRTSPRRKIHVTSKPPVGGISVVTLIRTDTTHDHSQKAEKVWIVLLSNCACAHCCAQVACLRFAFGGVAFARLRALLRQLYVRNVALHCWAEAPVKIARMSLTIKFETN